MDTLIHPQTTYLPQLLTIDVNLVPVGTDALDLYCRRFERVRRGWKFVLTTEEQGCKVRFRIHTTFAANVPYKLKTITVKFAGTTTIDPVNEPIYTLPQAAAGDEILLLDLIAAPQGAPNKPKRRGGGNLIIRDAGGGN
jgi:hypothetical protein